MKNITFPMLVILCLISLVFSGCTEKYIMREQVVVETREVVK
ncbi:MAG: hypothetical protein PHO00_03500 [bacterium]|nr:hypothetical protein [bacterium]